MLGIDGGGLVELLTSAWLGGWGQAEPWVTELVLLPMRGILGPALFLGLTTLTLLSVLSHLKLKCFEYIYFMGLSRLMGVLHDQTDLTDPPNDKASNQSTNRSYRVIGF